jgi:hypothetical protein
VGQWPDRFNHTTADTPQALDERSIERVVSAVAAAVLMLASAPALAGVTPWPPEEPAAAEAVVRRWSGPFNLHALRAALDPRTRERLLATCAADRLGSFGALQCLAYAIDATRNREAVRAVAERGFGEPIGEPLSDVFFDAMNQAGWIGVARG